LETRRVSEEPAANSSLTHRVAILSSNLILFSRH